MEAAASSAARAAGGAAGASARRPMPAANAAAIAPGHRIFVLEKKCHGKDEVETASAD
jgi:hypothetical protein